ncbi:hypothetical protein KC19_VG305200, partial [Ceratodon purpureus]
EKGFKTCICAVARVVSCILVHPVKSANTHLFLNLKMEKLIRNPGLHLLQHLLPAKTSTFLGAQAAAPSLVTCTKSGERACGRLIQTPSLRGIQCDPMEMRSAVLPKCPSIAAPPRHRPPTLGAIGSTVRRRRPICPASLIFLGSPVRGSPQPRARPEPRAACPTPASPTPARQCTFAEPVPCCLNLVSLRNCSCSRICSRLREENYALIPDTIPS